MVAYIEIGRPFENNADINNYFNNSDSKIDFEKFADIDSVNFKTVLPEIEIDQYWREMLFTAMTC